jgi:hypothetical protein
MPICIVNFSCLAFLCIGRANVLARWCSAERSINFCAAYPKLTSGGDWVVSDLCFRRDSFFRGMKWLVSFELDCLEMRFYQMTAASQYFLTPI